MPAAMHSRESTVGFHESLWGIGAIIFVHSVSLPSPEAAGWLALALIGIGWFTGRAESSSAW